MSGRENGAVSPAHGEYDLCPSRSPITDEVHEAVAIRFPSGRRFALERSYPPYEWGLVHLFGEVRLPYRDSRVAAYERLQPHAIRQRYVVGITEDNGLVVVGPSAAWIVRYDNAHQTITDIVPLFPES